MSMSCMPNWKRKASPYSRHPMIVRLGVPLSLLTPMGTGSRSTRTLGTDFLWAVDPRVREILPLVLPSKHYIMVLGWQNEWSQDIMCPVLAKFSAHNTPKTLQKVPVERGLKPHTPPPTTTLPTP